jgi:hypothetical protein
MVGQLWACPDCLHTILDRPHLHQTVWHPTSDSPESHRAHHKVRRRYPARPGSPRLVPDRRRIVPDRPGIVPDRPGIVPDRPVCLQTVRLHRLDHPKNHNLPVISLVQKVGIKIVGHVSPKSQKGYTSLSLFGLLRSNLLLALTRTWH